MRILIVEPNQELAEVLIEAMRAEGWELAHVRRHGDARARCQAQPFDVVLLELESYALTWPALRTAIRELRDAAVVLMSALDAPWRWKALSLGATACLRQPFDLDALLSLLACLEVSERMHVDLGLPGDVRRLSAAHLQQMGRLSSRELDILPFGVIRLDAHGTVTAYNDFEAGCAGYSPRQVVGRPLRELAPCLHGPAFVSAIKEAWTRGRLDRQFRAIVPHHSASVWVTVRVAFDALNRQVWLLISKRRGRGAHFLLHPDVVPWGGVPPHR